MKRFVKEILQDKGTEVVTVAGMQKVADALEKMAEANIGAVVVTDENGKMAGIFTERDYARKVIEKGPDPLGITVNEYMTSVVVTVDPDRLVDDCMALMTDKRCRHLPVLEDGKLSGLISIGDLVKASLEEKECLIKLLTEYIQYP